MAQSMLHQQLGNSSVQTTAPVFTAETQTSSWQMEVYASGFNAWSQLQFQVTESQAEPYDLHEFTCVLTGDAIDRPRPSLSYTTGKLLVLQITTALPYTANRAGFSQVH